MKRKGKIPGRYHKTLKEQVRENPRLAAVYVILRVLVVLALVAQVFNGNFENVFLCVLTLILYSIPSFIERTIRIDIPDTLEIIILLFIFAAEILGEIQAYYVQFPYWDTMLHTLNGFLCAAIGFSLLDILNRDERLAFKLSAVYLAGRSGMVHELSGGTPSGWMGSLISFFRSRGEAVPVEAPGDGRPAMAAQARAARNRAREARGLAPIRTMGWLRVAPTKETK